MAAEHSEPAGLSWAAYVDWLASESGSLAAAAERLSAHHGHRDDVGSIERALRRLRQREHGDGGKWGLRALVLFGLPGAAEARLRWLGAYHSRFTDLPVPVCEDLVRLWDRPPLNQSRAARAWLPLAQASVALRRADEALAATCLARVRAQLASAPPDAQVELLLIEAYLASRAAPASVEALLAAVAGPLARVTDDETRACLAARWVDQRAYALHRRSPPDYAASTALYEAQPPSDAPPFVLCRRAAGLAFVRWKLGHPDEAASLAREAVRHAGDGGHVRLRAMALTMLARVSQGPAADEARQRAAAIATRLDDETLRLRLARLPRYARS